VSAVLASGRPLCAVIDQSAYLHNLLMIERHCSPAQLLAVIKADGYGHGMIEMARAAGLRSLAVATPEEASRLIDEGIDNTIWVLEGPFSPACLALSSRHGSINWVVHQLSQLQMMAERSESSYQVWLKLDSGMHRLGFQSEQVASALAFIAKTKNLSLQGVMTHFAASEELDSPSALKQIQCFDHLLQSNGLSDLPQSLANSGAIINFAQTCRSVVRPGIASYGAMGVESLALKPVMSLQSAVMALHHVPVGESVGYGGIWTAERPSIIATIAGGYGDGYPRHAKNGTPVLVNGKRAPLAGRVSMDMLTVDVTALSEVQVGDPVELWGRDLAVEEVATCADTISYELLTSVTARVPRVYL
jgi:alanine racemase